MQNRNFNDPEQYENPGYSGSHYGQFNEHQGYYNPIPAERNLQESEHRYNHPRGQYSPGRDPNRPHINNPSLLGYDNPYERTSYNRNAPYGTSAWDRHLIDRYGNSRRGESIARGNYGIPGTDRFGNTWYYDPRNHANENQYPHEDPDRGLAQQFGDEVRSWFGNKEAARRREMDSRNSLGTAWHDNDNPNPSGYYDDERDREYAQRQNHDLRNRW